MITVEKVWSSLLNVRIYADANWFAFTIKIFTGKLLFFMQGVALYLICPHEISIAKKQSFR